jgi:hypothetical protein
MGCGMSLELAFKHRADMLLHAAQLAAWAANDRLPWGIRYRAAVTGDHCLDIAKEYDAFIRKHFQES